jgi:hypothetical protein
MPNACAEARRGAARRATRAEELGWPPVARRVKEELEGLLERALEVLVLREGAPRDVRELLPQRDEALHVLDGLLAHLLVVDDGAPLREQVRF